MKEQFGSSAYTHFKNQHTEQDIFQGSDINQIFEEMAKSFGFRGVDEIFNEFYDQGYQTFNFKRSGFSVNGFFFTGSLGKKNPGDSPLLSLPKNMGQITGYFLKKFTGLELPQNGTDIQDTLTLTKEHAKTGGTYAYFHKKKSKKLIVKIPKGVRDKQKIRLSGMGNDGKGNGASGDLYLTVVIKKPVSEKVKNYIGTIFKK